MCYDEKKLLKNFIYKKSTFKNLKSASVLQKIVLSSESASIHYYTYKISFKT